VASDSLDLQSAAGALEVRVGESEATPHTFGLIPGPAG